MFQDLVSLVKHFNHVVGDTTPQGLRLTVTIFENILRDVRARDTSVLRSQIRIENQMYEKQNQKLTKSSKIKKVKLPKPTPVTTRSKRVTFSERCLTPPPPYV